MRTFRAVVFCLLCAGVAHHALAESPSVASLRVGAAKVDVTPADRELPKNSLGVLDPLYARTIVMESGAAAAALITVDAGVITEDLWQAVTAQLESEFHIPPANVLLTATHTHSAPWRTSADLPRRIVESVRLARQAMAPARVGYGTGVSYININRNIIDPKTRRWAEGPNYDGPSDKTVSVLKFEREDGTPIAAYYNYAVHAVVSGQLDQVSADIPGAASNYIEDSHDGKVVAVWSTGATGDQNPIYFQQTYDLRDIRIKAYAKRGVDISNSMLPGGEGLDRGDPAVVRLMDQQRQMVKSMGQFLGEEVLRVMRGITRTESSVALFGGQATIQCPGRERTNEGRAGVEGTYKDGAPVDLKLSLLRIGDVAIGGVNAEVFNPIAQRLNRESPLEGTMLATLTNGMARSGYIPDDASFAKQTFEVLSSRLQPGCAESAIVNGLLDLIASSRGKEPHGTR